MTGDKLLTPGKRPTIRRVPDGEYAADDLERNLWFIDGEKPYRNYIMKELNKAVALRREYELLIFIDPKRLGPSHIIATYAGTVLL